MSVSAAPTRDRGYHSLPIKRIVPETADAASIVFDIPAELAPSYRYVAGQFLTFRVTLDASSTDGLDARAPAMVPRVDLPVHGDNRVRCGR